VAGRLDEEKAAVDTGVLDISFSLRSEFLSEVCRVLVLDIFDNWVPASVVVYLITIAGGIHNVQAQTNTVLFDNVRDSLDFGGRSNILIRSKSSLGVDEVRGKNGIDEGRLSETSLTNADNIELKTALQQFLLDLRRDAVKTDMASWIDRRFLVVSSGCHCCACEVSRENRKSL